MRIASLLAAVALATGLLAGASLAAGPAPAQPADARAFAARLSAAQAKLAMDLMPRLSTRTKPTVAVSPASLAGAAAALDLGASRDLRAGLHRVLGFTGPDAAGDLAALRRRVSELDTAGEGGPLRMANTVLFDKGLALYPGVALAFQQAGLDQGTVDFSAPDAAGKVNAWVREKTGGLIPEIVDRLGGSTSVVVLNALHFKDRWKTPFDAAETKEAAFRRVGARPVSVPTMHLPQGKYLFRQDARFVGIELPYADERFRMVIVTTRGARPALARTFRSAADWLTGRDFTVKEGELALPRFDVSAREDLTAAVDALGLRSARNSRASLSGFTSDPVRISRVLQRIEMRLNEEGTEAAAATAVVAERSAANEYVKMVVDRPFVFALRDAATGLILAAGYVGEPRAAAR